MVTTRRTTDTARHLEVILDELRRRWNLDLGVTAFLCDPDPAEAFRPMLASVPYPDRQLFLALVRAEVVKHDRLLTAAQEEFLDLYTTSRRFCPEFGDDVDHTQRDD